MLFGIPIFDYGGLSEYVTIPYNEGTGTNDPNDIRTQHLPNLIIYDMMYVLLPKKKWR